MKAFPVLLLMFFLVCSGATAQPVLKDTSFSVLNPDSSVHLSQGISIIKDAKPVFKRDTILMTVSGAAPAKIINSQNVSNGQAGIMTATDVGRTATSLDVSATGGATFTVPLTLPPGLGNAVPQLALTYNSQAGNGIAGYGWSISGLSTISRISSTLFHDNKIGGINFDQNDRFALDGQRLLLKSGTYGGNGTEYQTENYSNVKIISWGVSPYGVAYGPEYFEVLYPDGSKALYGATANSRTPFEYAITYSEGPLGARISYTYQQNNNVLLITQISYGSMGTASGINQVNFSYTGAVRAEQSWVGGQSFYRDQILSKITVTAQGELFRNYQITYSTVSTLNYQRIESIQEFNGTEDHSLPPIQFSYSSTGNIITKNTISNLYLTGITSTNSETLTSDFTGNGSMDFILYPNARNKIWAFYDLEAGSPYMQVGYEVATGIFRDIFSATVLTSASKVFPGQGMIVLKSNGGNSYRFEVLVSGTATPVNFQYDHEWNTPPLSPSYFSGCDNQVHPGSPLDLNFISGDFDGNGLTDIIAINRGGEYVTYEYLEESGLYRKPPPVANCIQVFETVPSSVYLIDMDRRVTSDYISNTGNLSFLYELNDRLYTGDFNGDGKTDILHIKGSAMYVYTLNQNRQLQLLWSVTNDMDIQPARLALFGDYNGDGKTDIMFSTGYNSHFITFVSTGKGFVKHDQYQPFYNTQSSQNGDILTQYFLIPNDIDGDGKTDIIAANTTTQNNSTSGLVSITVFHNTGTSASSQPEFGSTTYSSFTTELSNYPIPLFLNPDKLNQKLELGFMSNNSISLFKFGKDQRVEALLTDIQQDGVSHSVVYKPLLVNTYTDDIPLYEDGHDQTYPYADVPNAAPMNVVSKVTRSSGGQTVSQVFGYGEAVTHLQGLGFMGFGRLVKSNWHTGAGDANRLFTVGIYDPQLRGANIKSFTGKSNYISPTILSVSLSNPPPATGIADGASQYDYISRSDIAWHTELLPNKVFVNIPVATASKDMLSGTFATQAIEYDPYYNRTKVTGNFSGAGTKTEEFTYENNPGSPYYIGRLLSSQTTVNNGASSFSNREEYTYNGWLPSQVRKQGNNTPFITEDLAYDSFGNVTQRTVTVPGGAQRTVTMEYDASGRYLTRQTDPDGMAASFTYNTSTGTLSGKTNPYGQTKTYSYDSWSRLASNTEFIGGVTTQVSYQKDGNNNTVVTETSSEGSSSVSIMNPLGQTVETWVTDMSGQYVGKAIQYDVYGRKIAESEPARPGSYNQWNYTEYDEYDRVKKQTSFTGQVTAISYSGLTTTVNDGAKTVTTTRNALGHITSAQDPGGTINYTYFANGALKAADYGGIVQTIEQDGWGRKTSLTDPSAGQYQYQYDGFGQLTKETTPKGVTDYTYDAYGKITQKKLTGDDTGIQLDYTYDGATKLLTGYTMTNSDGNNAVYSYTYDQDKRVSSIAEDNLHARFVTEYTYNSNDRIATESHEAKNKLNNVTVKKTIEMQYQNGELLQTTLQGTGQILWKVNSLDDKGRITTALQGSSLKTTFQYDQYGLPQQKITERISGSPATLMTLGYSFDSQRGLLTSRSNSAFSWSENFAYDNLDRLTDFNDNDGNHNQAYDSRGRITSSSQLGDYSYQGDSYRQSELALNPAADALYQGIPLQQVTYNAFKSPVSIYEQGHERISFQYNSALGRSHMYYGGEQEDKMQRRYRRHYSEDGAVEITNDIQAGTTSFVFYLGGDAYSAPAIWKEVYSGSQSTQNLYYLHRDHLSSIVLITDEQGNAVEKRQFDAWGNIVRLTDGNGNNLSAFVIIDRGYTGHEHLLGVGLIHMNGRLYDPRLHRFLSPDNYVQDPFNTQNFNRFAYAMNNPLTYVDQSGEFLWMIPIVAAFVFGTTNLAIQAANGEIHNFWDGVKAFGSGAIAGAAVGTGIASGLSIPILGTTLKVAGAIYAGATSVSVVSGTIQGIATGDWSSLENTVKLFAGNFYLDGNRNFLAQILQGISRFSWELPQSTAGYTYSQFRNAFGGVDRVDYFGGATFATKENAGGRQGVSLGNYINISIADEIEGNFVDRVISDPLFMHEYGHTFDSQIFGLSYLFGIGVPSFFSAAGLEHVNGEPTGVSTHDFRWYEMRANRHAARYFGKYYGVDWNTTLLEGTYETYYPRKKR